MTVAASGLALSGTQSRLKVFTKASAMPFDSGLLTGVKQGTRPIAKANATYRGR